MKLNHILSLIVVAGAASAGAATTSTPSFSTGAGTYHAPPAVKISVATSHATIYYTLDGSTPTTSSAVYTAPIVIGATTTLKALAVAAGSPSAVASATYTISAPLTPSFSTGGGSYHAPQTVKLSDGTAGTTIYYTTDGSTPTTSSAVYAGPITVNSATTVLNAIAAVPGGPASAVASATYTISPALTPSFSTGGGSYHTAQTVKISDGTSGATIYYTTDGSTPTTSSAVYSGPIAVTGASTTLNAIAAVSGGPASAVASATYTISAALPPSFSTGTGAYHTPPTVKITDGTAGATIYYTTDGSTPTTSSKVYSGPFTVGSATAANTTTVNAIAVQAGGPASPVASATYTITAALAPVLSITSGTFARSVAVTISDGIAGTVIHYTTDGSTPTAASPVYAGPVTLSNRSTFSSTATLKAIAVYPGGPPSAVVSGSYTILSNYIPVRDVNSNTSFFGINVKGLLDGVPWPLVSTGNYRILGEETNWTTLNPADGTYVWKSLDQEINLARNNDAQLLYTFVNTPAWAIATNLGITSISRTSGVVTATTAVPHNLYYNPSYLPTEQTSVTIAGSADSSFNGTFQITGSTATTLTWAQPGPDSTSSAGSLSAVCSNGDGLVGCTEAPASLAKWDAYVTALIDHVGPGVIKYWELWNEANIADGWAGDPQMLVAMAADARAIIKKVDPKAIILSPSTTINFETPTECATMDPRCGSNWLNSWLAAGGKNYIDAVAFHGYPQLNESPEQVQGAVTLEQVAMNQNGVGSLPIIDTESSWGLTVNLPDESDQAAFLSRHLLLEHSIGVQASFWYAYNNAQWGQLWTSTAGLNPAGEAHQQVARWITGVSVVHPCNSTIPDPTTYTCTYTRPNGYTAIAVWNTTGAGSFAVPAGMVQYRDLSGDVIPVSGGKVPTSSSPILLESGNPTN